MPRLEVAGDIYLVRPWPPPPRAVEPMRNLAFVNAAGHSITEYAMSSVDIVSSLGESKVGRELA
jgi:hypothetical protein